MFYNALRIYKNQFRRQAVLPLIMVVKAYNMTAFKESRGTNPPFYNIYETLILNIDFSLKVQIFSIISHII